MSVTAWEFVFTMFVLKLPILYLIGVVWYAVRAEPRPPAPFAVAARVTPGEPCPWRGARRRLPRPRSSRSQPRPRVPQGARA